MKVLPEDIITGEGLAVKMGLLVGVASVGSAITEVAVQLEIVTMTTTSCSLPKEATTPPSVTSTQWSSR